MESSHDVSELERAMAALAEQKMFAENLVQNSAVPTFVVNADRQVIIWNRACEELTGIKAESMLGKAEAWRAFYNDRHPVLAEIVLDGTLSQGSTCYPLIGRSSFIPEGLQAEGWYENLHGKDRYIIFNAAPIRNSKGELLAVIETFEDVTERKHYEEQLEYHANHDRLTNLPNRNLLFDRIHQALLRSQRNHQQIAIIFIDLDNFKYINDSLGHDIGDELLKTIADRLRTGVRAGDTVARLGGDEFVIIISHEDVAEVAANLAGSIQSTITKPLRIKEHELVVTCSIGISISPKDGEDVQTLIRNADIAMYRSKEKGRNTFRFFTGQMNARLLARMTMEKQLRHALERNELFLCYQPIVNLRSNRVNGVEALVRWQNSETELITPSDFIPLAEETGLIEPIGEWVLQTACAQNRVWQDRGLPLLPVSVNISALQFRLKDFVRTVDRVLQESGLDPRYLELEVTESLVMQNFDRVTTTLNELKEMGIRLSMDDFGTGYSSLSYLKRFPFDKLKIDQSFVKGIANDPDCAAIIRTIIAMAHSLRLNVVAEGVETDAQLNYLRLNNCDAIQGYYFSKPVKAVSFSRLLRKNRQLPVQSSGTDNEEWAILVVDDEPHVTASLQRMFRAEGYVALAASSAAEGLELLATRRIGVVISDLWMPVMNGSEFLELVKELYPDVVRISLTGRADLFAIIDAVNRGTVFKMLTKPWDETIVLATVKESFALHRMAVSSAR